MAGNLSETNSHPAVQTIIALRSIIVLRLTVMLISDGKLEVAPYVSYSAALTTLHQARGKKGVWREHVFPPCDATWHP